MPVTISDMMTTIKFCTKGIRAMAKQSPPLEYAVAGFSSLVYSVHVDHSARSYAFVYYADALRGLQEMLNRLLLGIEDSLFAAIATVLQLASMEVHHVPLPELTIAFRRGNRKGLSSRKGCSSDTPALFEPCAAMFDGPRS